MPTAQGLSAEAAPRQPLASPFVHVGDEQARMDDLATSIDRYRPRMVAALSVQAVWTRT